MSLKLLTQLSHFITMIFGTALGMSLCMLYQLKVQIFIMDLIPLIISMVIISILLRIYTLIIWKKYNYESKINSLHIDKD